MNKSEFIANRLQEVLLNGQWIANTNYKAQIENITWEQATHKVGALNSIAALTYHINYYIEGVLQVLNGGALEIRDKYSFDMPPIRSEDDWKRLVQEFIYNSEKFIDCVIRIPESKWDEVFVDQKYGTYARNIEGIIEHSYYHLGQISLIRKLILENQEKHQ